MNAPPVDPRARRARFLFAAGLPGAALFLRTVVDLLGWRLSIVNFDVETMDSMLIRLGLSALCGLPLLLGLNGILKEAAAGRAEDSRARARGEPRGGWDRSDWLQPLLLSVVMGSLVLPGIPLVARQFTRAPQNRAFEETLRALGEAQERYRDQHFAYSGDLRELGITAPEGATVMLSSGTIAWSATLIDAESGMGCVGSYGDVGELGLGSLQTPGGRVASRVNELLCDDF